MKSMLIHSLQIEKIKKFYVYFMCICPPPPHDG